MAGITIQMIFGEFRQFLDDYFLSPPALVIASGFIMLFVAALGACGAIKESAMLINLYGVCLFLIFILHLSAAIAGYALRDAVREMLVRTMNESLCEYEANEYIRHGVDFMQTNLDCCGINSPSDWKPVLSQNKNNTDPMDIYVPPSCCDTVLWDTTAIQQCTFKIESGCLNRLDFVISRSATLIATGATADAFFLLLGVGCAFMFAKYLRRYKSIREARRWQLQQSLGVLFPGRKTLLPPTDGYQKLGKQDNLF